MNLKLSILSFCVVITTAREHHIRANLDDGHRLRFRATESALRRLLEREESIRSKKDAEEFHVLRGSGRFLPSTNCGEGGITWSCDRDTEECSATPDECITVCVAEDDCNGNGECKNGDSCECDDRFDGDACDKCARSYYRYNDDCRYYDVGIAYEFIFDFADNEEAEEECLEVIAKLQVQFDALLDDLPDEATVKVSGSGKSKRSHRRHLKPPHSKSELEVPILVEVGECDSIELVNAAILAVQDVSLPTGATFRTGRSKGSRD
mmetsp:Transcript_3765/g.5795  ORF Transcript_3765/g.5795 Transcript_3765/m.5795 type:complete len:265 (+) Transcript_3765:140-934(+)|eukprot:scaffold8637_cov153-Skeletonema_dohrnii-CCMP3373.AAC.16